MVLKEEQEAEGYEQVYTNNKIIVDILSSTYTSISHTGEVQVFKEAIFIRSRL